MCIPMLSNSNQLHVCIEFLITSYTCIESCVPLLTATHLPWLISLCRAVCHCYELLDMLVHAGMLVCFFSFDADGSVTVFYLLL
jgi:hypothetical protein